MHSKLLSGPALTLVVGLTSFPGMVSAASAAATGLASAPQSSLPGAPITGGPVSVQIVSMVDGIEEERDIDIVPALSPTQDNRAIIFAHKPLLAFAQVDQPIKSGLPRSVRRVSPRGDETYYAFRIILSNDEIIEAARQVAARHVLRQSREGQVEQMLSPDVRPWPVRHLLLELRDRDKKTLLYGVAISSRLTDNPKAVDVSVPIPTSQVEEFERRLIEGSVEAAMSISSNTVEYDFATVSATIGTDLKGAVSSKLSNSVLGRQGVLLRDEMEDLRTNYSTFLRKSRVTTNPDLLAKLESFSFEKDLFEKKILEVNDLVGDDEVARQNLAEWLKPLIHEVKTAHEKTKTDKGTTARTDGIKPSFGIDASGKPTATLELNRSDAKGGEEATIATFKYNETTQEWVPKDIYAYHVRDLHSIGTVGGTDTIIQILKAAHDFNFEGNVSLGFSSPSVRSETVPKPGSETLSYVVVAKKRELGVALERRPYAIPSEKQFWQCRDEPQIESGKHCFKVRENGSDRTPPITITPSQGWQFDINSASITHFHNTYGEAKIDSKNLESITFSASISSYGPNKVKWAVNVDEVRIGSRDVEFVVDKGSGTFRWGKDEQISLPPGIDTYAVKIRLGNGIERIAQPNDLRAAAPFVEVIEAPNRASLTLRPTALLVNTGD